MTRPVDNPIALTRPAAPTAAPPTAASPASPATAASPPTAASPAVADQPSRPRRRGRPLEDDIRATVVDLLAEHGYAALTMDLVAARARAGKATLYRRWSGKLDLVADAVAQLGAAPATDPDTGSLRGDVLAQLRDLARSLTGRHGAASASVIGELERHPQLGVAVRSALVDHRREVAERISRRAVRRGEARADAPWGTVNEIGPALLFARVLLAGETVDEDYLAAVVDGVVLPLVTRQAPPREPSSLR